MPDRLLFLPLILTLPGAAAARPGRAGLNRRLSITLAAWVLACLPLAAPGTHKAKRMLAYSTLAPQISRGKYQL